MIRSVKADVDLGVSIAPDGNRTASVNGSGVDLRGYGAGLAVVQAGTITDGTHTPKLQESNDNSTWTDVAAGDLDGAFADLASNTIQRVGYKGSKRYLRVVVTVTGSPATGGKFSAAILRAHPTYAPLE